MTAREALETVIKPALATMLGENVANAVTGGAFFKLASLSLGGASEEEKLGALVDGLCAEPRLKKCLGEARLKQLRLDWVARAR